MRAHYIVHALLFIGCVQSVYALGGSVIGYLLPVTLLQGCYWRKLKAQYWLYLQPRQWCIEQHQTRLKQNDHWHLVDLEPVYIARFLVVLRFQKLGEQTKWWQSKWLWDVIMFDACDDEPFRQFRAAVKTRFPLKENQKI